MQKEESGAPLKDRERLATLGAGLFTNGVWDMLSVLVPLYAVAVGLSATEIGLVVSARSLLPAALSIHGGILMDELGTRRMLRWVAAGSMTLPLLYPVAGWFAVLVVLQLLLGLSSSLGMAASQTWSMQSSRGDTAMLARFSVFSRIGTFLGPVIVGAAWDLFGAWIAFACVSLCGAGIVASAAYGAPARAPDAPAPRALNVIVPQWAQHKRAIALAAIPAVAFVLAVSFLRNAPGAIQASLYVVYLDGIGMSGTVIGLLVAISELGGVLGSLFAAPMERRMRGDRLVLLCIASSVTAIAVTPLVGAFLTLLFVASVIRGIGQGISQPLMYSILSRAAPSTRHGASVGLRNAVVRLASIVTPTAMGVVAEAWSIEASFYVMGAAFLVATAALAGVARRALASAKSPAA
ncbi:MAG: MFS transporter [Betaproteobacteria bacterium]|nr:MFS transporter [Betaproteobacteria bacterium]